MDTTHNTDTDTDDPATWRQYVEARTTGQKYQARDVAGVA